jgi:hypothetical protein
MRFVRITDDSTRADLEEAMVHLRAEQKRVMLAECKAEIGADLDELLDMWARG